MIGKEASDGDTASRVLPTTQPKHKCESGADPISSGHCALLSLPLELRNRVYELSLVRKSPIAICPLDRTGGEQPGLLQTCRQLRSECQRLFYELNIFRVISRSFCRRNIGPLRWHLDKVRKFQFRIPEHTTVIQLNFGFGPRQYGLHVLYEQTAEKTRCTCMETEAAATTIRKEVKETMDTYGGSGFFTECLVLRLSEL